MKKRSLKRILEQLDLNVMTGGKLSVYTPIDGSLIGRVSMIVDNPIVTLDIVEDSVRAFDNWRKVPAPIRGDFIRLLGNELREYKEQLGGLVTIECGKIYQEGLGEVQEMIDICDFAVGLSRQLYGLTMGSERPGHKLMETWHPLGPTLIISAFNFPVAVWSWNFALATVCGNSVIWKPSEKTPLTALACHGLVKKAAIKFNKLHPDTPYPKKAHQIAITDNNSIAQRLVEDSRVRLVSATGSTAMGKVIAPIVAARLGRSLLELGGNNGMIVSNDADWHMALKAIVFSAVGTAGQRCTTLRRVFANKRVMFWLTNEIIRAYDTINIGDSMNEKNLMGPLIDKDAYDNMQAALKQAVKEGGRILCGGERALQYKYPKAYYVTPAAIVMPRQSPIMRKETFAPILYIVEYESLDWAIEQMNSVKQGLSSCIFTNDLREAEKFLAETDTGIANVNVGPSGAEIGGAFGGEKDTGGGRESGSDAWKNYMRRATNTINYSEDMPLAQGVKFDM